MAEGRLPRGDGVIRGPLRDSEIVITTTARLAGAIHSLTWDGVEFIDSADHGRQLQSASNFDAGLPLTAETFNPTEAGSRDDGAGERSTSRLLQQILTQDALQTTTRMAFWLAPGERSGEHLAKNTTRLSNHLLTKRVQIGCQELPQVVQYDVTFSVPIGEHHRHGVFEALTGYMPPRFSEFWAYDPEERSLKPLDDGPGEQSRPVVLATPDRRHAMGIYSPAQPSRGFEHVGYGRFRFAAERVVKWNCVFRVSSAEGLAAGEYTFPCRVIVGDWELVQETLRLLTK